jgi:hypothetical protein
VAIPYASADDLAAWLEAPVPDNVDQLLRSATFIIAAAINETPYTIVADQPRKDATTAQAAAWAASGLDPSKLAAAATGLLTKSKNIGTASVSYDVPTVEQQQAAVKALAPDAYNILYVTGLLVVPLPNWNIPLDTTTYPPSSPGGLPVTWPLDVGYGGY